MTDLKIVFEKLYKKYNRREYVSPDPLQFLYKFDTFENIEITGLISSSFAYGRVQSIINFLEKIFNIMENPYYFLMENNETSIKKKFSDFKYRFTTSEELSFFLIAIKRALTQYNSLYNLFYNYYSQTKSLIKSMELFINTLRNFSNYHIKTLLPDVKKGSSLKRFNLFLRWMIRKDNVDIGIWKKIPRKELIVPLDTHMFKIAKQFNFTKKSSANLKTAIEITDKFRELSPEDPVKYDFVLTRFGINPEFKNKSFN